MMGVARLGQFLQDKFQTLKQQGSGYRTELMTPDGRVGDLVPIGSEDLDDDNLVASIMAWREAHRDKFATRIAAPSLSRTKAYLKMMAVGDPRRLLCRILAQDGVLAGHLGLVQISAAAADLDNLMLGEAKYGLDLIYRAELALIALAFSDPTIEVVGADVLTTNRGVQLIHRMAGLSAFETLPLDQVITSHGDEVLQPARNPADPTSRIGMLRMSIDRATFLERHPKGQELIGLW